jgi:hypothetical protein
MPRALGMSLESVTASNLHQSIAGDIVEICGYWRQCLRAPSGLAAR